MREVTLKSDRRQQQMNLHLDDNSYTLLHLNEKDEATRLRGRVI